MFGWRKNPMREPTIKICGVCLLITACGTAPIAEHGEPEPASSPAVMLCIPEPEPSALLRGRPAPGGWWEPRCAEGLTPAPCELGPVCSADGDCSCRCEHAGDCREMAVGVAALSSVAVRSTECVENRCVWGPE
jgi:hypothetical protein